MTAMSLFSPAMAQYMHTFFSGIYNPNISVHNYITWPCKLTVFRRMYVLIPVSDGLPSFTYIGVSRNKRSFIYRYMWASYICLVLYISTHVRSKVEAFSLIYKIFFISVYYEKILRFSYIHMPLAAKAYGIWTM